MPYRRSGETLEVRTAAGAHEVVTTLDGLEVRGPDNTHVVITRTTATIQTRARRSTSLAIHGHVVVAENVARNEVGLWIESQGAMRRVFSVPNRAAKIAMHGALRRHHPTIVSATEIGAARHRMLLVELTDRHLLYAGRLFREHADLALTLFHNGRVDPDGTLMLTVHGHDVRFLVTNEQGAARFAFPWLAPSDRMELARRLTLAMQHDAPIARTGM
jgi:hypothetical protein